MEAVNTAAAQSGRLWRQHSVDYRAFGMVHAPISYSIVDVRDGVNHHKYWVDHWRNPDDLCPNFRSRFSTPD
jgi:hypothetical protein